MEWKKVLQTHPCEKCGEPARWLHDGMWLCQEHYDEITQGSASSALAAW